MDSECLSLPCIFAPVMQDALIDPKSACLSMRKVKDSPAKLIIIGSYQLRIGFWEV